MLYEFSMCLLSFPTNELFAYSVYLEYHDVDEVSKLCAAPLPVGQEQNTYYH